MNEALADTLRTTRQADVDLVAGARAGRRDAFDRLMAVRMEPTFRTAMAIIGHEADARDATQETFVKAWRDLDSLRELDRFDAWLGRILVNTCRTILRKRSRAYVREVSITTFDGGADPPASQSADVFVEETAGLDAVERAFRRLNADERTLLVLHHLEHRPLALIAATLGIPEGTAKSRLHHARRALERALEVERR